MTPSLVALSELTQGHSLVIAKRSAGVPDIRQYFLRTDRVPDRHIESNAQRNQMFDLGAWLPETHTELNSGAISSSLRSNEN